MTDFPIVFAADDKYIKYTSVAIASIISNSNKNFHYKIFILIQDISKENQQILENFIKDYENFSIDFISINDIDENRFYLNSYMPVSIYYRLYIPELFKQYDRVLYLDSDLIVDTDISEFTTINFDDNVAIAIQDEYLTEKINEDDPWFPKEYFYNTLKLTDTKKYFNSGVILFDIKKMNQLNLFSKFFHTLFNEVKEPIQQDQDILNCVLNTYGGGVKLISNKYNFMPHIRATPYYITYKDIFLSRLKSILNLDKKERKDFFIYHFLTSNKPWNSNRPDNMLFYKYLYSKYVVNPPKKFVSEIIKENRKKHPLWWKFFMKYFS